MADKVLIIDDDEPVRTSLHMHFEDCNFLTKSIISAEEAIELIKTESFQLAIVDLRLPKMDGLDFIRQANKICPDMQYIIHTGSVEIIIPEDIRSMNTVSSTVFRKPVSDLNLISEKAAKIIKKIKK